MKTLEKLNPKQTIELGYDPNMDFKNNHFKGNDK